MMLRGIAIFAILLSFATQSIAAEKVSALSASDEAAVRALVNGFADSWNRHDMKAMHDLDTDDVEWINVVGQQWRSKATVMKGHTAIHKGMNAHTTMIVESAIIRSIAPNVAIAVTTNYFSDTATPATDPDATKTRSSFIAVKRDGAWKIVHFQNTPINRYAENDDVPSFSEKGFWPPSK
jgi:uncharacterized protein (TIGR02246 family)